MAVTYPLAIMVFVYNMGWIVELLHSKKFQKLDHHFVHVKILFPWLVAGE